MIEHFKVSGWRVRLVYVIIALILLMNTVRYFAELFGFLEETQPIWALWS